MPVQSRIEACEFGRITRRIQQQERMRFEGLPVLASFDAHDERRMCAYRMRLVPAHDHWVAGGEFPLAETQDRWSVAAAQHRRTPILSSAMKLASSDSVSPCR